MTTRTNLHNVDPAIVAAIENDQYDKGDADVSITQLINPGQIAYLSQQHGGELTEDASEGLWRLLGSAVHVVLEQAGVHNALQEERFTAEIAGWKVSGKIDLYRQFPLTVGAMTDGSNPRDYGEIVDFKVTSVWSFQFGMKPEWEAQANAYAALLRLHGFPVTKLTILAILRDWTKTRSFEHDYPAIPFVSVDVPVWDTAKATAWLAERVRLHQYAREGHYDPCTLEERWERPAKYAVMHVTRKRALRLLDSEDEAELWRLQKAPDIKSSYVEYRPGVSVRCESYCPVRDFCPQKAAMATPLESTLEASIEAVGAGE